MRWIHAIACALLCTVGLVSQAAVPETLHFSGKLDTGGTALTDSVAITFTLYTDPTSTDANIWTVTQTVSVVEGRFYATLAGVTHTMLAGGVLHLGIQVESDPEMSPRIALLSVPFARQADDALTVGGKAPSDFADSGHTHPLLDLEHTNCSEGQVLTSNGSAWSCGAPPVLTEDDPQVGANTTNTVPKWDGTALVAGSITDTGNIGVGIAAPSSTLDVAGDVKIRLGSNNNTNLWFADAAGTQTGAIEVQPTGTMILTRNSDSAGFLFRTGVQAQNQTLSISGGGKVGIGPLGSPGPAAALHVIGDSAKRWLALEEPAVRTWRLQYSNLANLQSVPMLEITTDKSPGLGLFVDEDDHVHLWDRSVPLPLMPHTGIRPTLSVWGDILVGDILAIESNPMTYFMRVNTNLPATSVTQFFSARTNVNDTDGGAAIVLAPDQAGEGVNSGYISLVAYGQGTGPLANAIRFQTRSGTNQVADRMIVTGNGNVGIGIAAPTATLEIGGVNNQVQLRVRSNPVSQGPFIAEFYNPAGATVLGINAQGGLKRPAPGDLSINNHGGGSITFLTSSTGNKERARINATGNMGIGTVSPAQRLHVWTDAGSGKPAVFERDGGTTATQGQLDVLISDVTGGAADAILQAGASSDILLRANAGLGGSLTVTSGGNVGVGTTSPGAMLDVAGDINATGSIKIGSSATCDSTTAGTLRYVASTRLFEGCDGVHWHALQTGNIDSCNDTHLNQNETDVDCGGLCPGCADGKTCSVAADCTSGVCATSVCQVPTCIDGVKNGTEEGVDCDGSCPVNCSLWDNWGYATIGADDSFISTGSNGWGTSGAKSLMNISGNYSISMTMISSPGNHLRLGFFNSEDDPLYASWGAGEWNIACMYGEAECEWPENPTPSDNPSLGACGAGDTLTASIEGDYFVGYFNGVQICKHALYTGPYGVTVGGYGGNAALDAPNICSDGIENQNETGVDCGSVCGKQCTISFKDVGTNLIVSAPGNIVEKTNSTTPGQSNARSVETLKNGTGYVEVTIESQSPHYAGHALKDTNGNTSYMSVTDMIYWPCAPFEGFGIGTQFRIEMAGSDIKYYLNGIFKCSKPHTLTGPVHYLYDMYDPSDRVSRVSIVMW